MVQPRLAERGQTAPASPIRRLRPFAVQAERRGVHVHHLNIGQPDLPTPQVMLDAYRGFDADVVAYSPSEGHDAYREDLAASYAELDLHGQAPVRADQIVVTTGGSEALIFAIAAVCDPGDQLLVAEPYYTNYRGMAHILGVGVTALTTHVDQGFRIDPAAVEAALTAQTRAFVLTSPGNPTGAVVAREDLLAIADICRERGIFLIADEVYRDFVYTEDGSLDHAATALGLPDFDEHAIVIDSVSKRYSACGARIGCLISRNPAVVAAAIRFAQARLSPPTVDQLAAHAALSTPRRWLREAITTYRLRRDALIAGLRTIEGVQVPTPRGAFYLIADLPVTDAEAFATFLLREFELDGETVMLAPAEGFYASPGLGRSQVRIAYVLDVPKLERCVEILRAGLAAWQARASHG
jgi:aspartate aminotransferase